MTAQTTWQDLAKLGWPKQRVYDAANRQRNGTMNGLGDILLNEGISLNYGWYSYNIVLGPPYPLSSRPNTTSREEVSWSYDNTKNNQTHRESWTESWESTVSVDVTIDQSTSINLSTSITIANVAQSGLSVTINTGQSTTEHKQLTHSLSRSWEMVVEPGEKLSLYRTITSTTNQTLYGVDFGLKYDSVVGTKGNNDVLRWNDHYYWSMNLNSLCNYPKGTLHIQGNSSTTNYGFGLFGRVQGELSRLPRS
ncbi:hypothetical protein D9757_013987 [Collybiopsis confluens]|uniref:Cytolysin n=1 Tax=Collybiopsis confluens TaxID=2823264 RepID=A0A8H5CNE1_9AGAR|nr:hypothetical protein D9757_013987 [Collybiopsis confluens]